MNAKKILSVLVLLVGSLVTTSCTNDSDSVQEIENLYEQQSIDPEEIKETDV